MESRKPDVSDLAQYKLAKFVGTQGYQGRVHRALSAAAGQVSPSLAITSDYNIQDEEDSRTLSFELSTSAKGDKFPIMKGYVSAPLSDRLLVSTANSDFETVDYIKAVKFEDNALAEVFREVLGTYFNGNNTPEKTGTANIELTCFAYDQDMFKGWISHEVKKYYKLVSAFNLKEGGQMLLVYMLQPDIASKDPKKIPDRVMIEPMRVAPPQSKLGQIVSFFGFGSAPTQTQDANAQSGPSQAAKGAKIPS